MGPPALSAGVAGLLAGPAQHRWCARDVNQLIGDWAGVHGWIPDTPHPRSACSGRCSPGTGTSRYAPQPWTWPATPPNSPPPAPASPSNSPPANTQRRCPRRRPGRPGRTRTRRRPPGRRRRPRPQPRQTDPGRRRRRRRHRGDRPRRRGLDPTTPDHPAPWRSGSAWPTPPACVTLRHHCSVTLRITLRYVLSCGDKTCRWGYE